jgi:hypothetical protein
LRTTRKVGLDGLTDKLNTEKAGRNRTADLDAVRTRWAELTNERLRENGIEARVDHRSLKDQGIDREPTSHMGPAVAAMERRGVKTEVGKRIEDEVADRLVRARAEGVKERELAQASRSVIDLSGDLAAAKRDLATTELVGQAKTQLVSGAADFRAQFMADRAAKIELERQAELLQQAAERAQFDARRKAELERIAEERINSRSKDHDGPGYSR